MASNFGHIKNNEELRIVMVGKTGIGKSATGNTILGRKCFESKLSATSMTEECFKGKAVVNGQKVAVIDTPGLFDTRFGMDKTTKDLTQCISFASPGPHVFLVVIGLGRYTEEEKQTVQKIQEIFGQQADKYTMVLFTHGDKLDEDTTIEDFLGGSSDLQELVGRCNGMYHVLSNKLKDRSQVTELLQKIRDITKKNGGSHYTSEMFQEAERKIEEEKQHIMREKQEQIQKEIEELERKLKDKFETEMKKMNEQLKAERERERKEIEEERKRERKEIEEERKRERKEIKEEMSEERKREKEEMREERKREKEEMSEERKREKEEMREEMKREKEEMSEERKREKEKMSEEWKREKEEMSEERKREKEEMSEERKREKEEREAERKREKEEREAERKREKEERENMMRKMTKQHEKEVRDERDKLQVRHENEAREMVEQSNHLFHVPSIVEHLSNFFKSWFK